MTIKNANPYISISDQAVNLSFQESISSPSFFIIIGNKIFFGKVLYLLPLPDETANNDEEAEVN
jgi:hypothetical protein